jgi:hypothetical protein
MQGYKDWKDGLLTTEELLEGKVFREPPALRKMWEQIIARARNDWSKVPHHHLCCCSRCAPTEEDRKTKIAMHRAEQAHDLKEFISHDLACCCDECLSDMERGMQEFEELCKCDHKEGSFCFVCVNENLAPSDCEPES